MLNLEIFDEKFFNFVNFNLEYFFCYFIGIMVSFGFFEKLIFKVDNVVVKYLVLQLLYYLQKLVKEGKNCMIFEMEVYVFEELICIFLSYGVEIEVLELYLLCMEMGYCIKVMKEVYG